MAQGARCMIDFQTKGSESSITSTSAGWGIIGLVEDVSGTQKLRNGFWNVTIRSGVAESVADLSAPYNMSNSRRKNGYQRELRHQRRTFFRDYKFSSTKKGLD